MSFAHVFIPPVRFFLLRPIARATPSSTAKQHVRETYRQAPEYGRLFPDRESRGERELCRGKSCLERVVGKCELREKRILTKGDFTYFCALNTPQCGPQKFRVFCDWVFWVFPFDDFFDNGELKNDIKGAKTMLNNLIDSMHGKDEPSTKFVCAHQDMWTRFQEASRCDD